MATGKSGRQVTERNKSATTRGGGRPRIVWDTADVRSAYANVFSVTGGREEIVLNFGRKGIQDNGRNELEVQVTNKILMSPFTAKRLAILLQRGISQYESKYGPLEEASTPSTAQEQMRSLIRNPPFSKTDKTAEKVGPLFQLITDLNVEVGYERSFKMLDKTLLGTRFLLGIKKDTIRGEAHEKVLEMCTQLDMPDNFLEDFLGYLPEANVVLFGFEENERGCVCKAYLEFGSRFEKEIKKKPYRPDPFLFHLGFKWDAEDHTKRAVTRYTCFPLLSVEAILERISGMLDPYQYGSSLELAKDFVDTASSRVPHYDILFLDVNEDNSTRRSFDINMYRANMRLEELYPIFSSMCQHYSIPSEEFHMLYDPVKTEIFGHLGGGIDREGRDYLTVYYGVEGYYIP